MRSIAIVDDHPMVLMVMTTIAQSVFPDASIVGLDCFVELQKLVSGGNALDLALLDLGLPGCAGISALTHFRAIAPEVGTVVISANEDSAVVRAALDAGARGYIPKTAKPPVVASALRLVASGGIYVPPQALAETSHAAELKALTDRQQDVLRLIAQGLANKEIAKKLSIAEDTVKQHAKAVYAALGITSRSQAVRFGIKLD